MATIFELILQGQILTPVVLKKRGLEFHVDSCKVSIKNPKRRYYSKIVVSKPMYPYSFICYLGNIEILYRCKSKAKAKQKLLQLLKIQHIGHFSSEGMGLVKWQQGSVKKGNTNLPTPTRQLRMRKGLPHNLPLKVQELIRYALLHDFFDTSKHQSKIYVQPELEDKHLVGLLQQHHNKTTNRLIQQFQKYDQLAAIITRKIRSPKINRYNWKAGEKNLDFKKIATEVKEVSNNVWKLYEYIYNSKELELLNEALQYGHSSLRMHLVILANLIVRDAQRKKL